MSEISAINKRCAIIVGKCEEKSMSKEESIRITEILRRLERAYPKASVALGYSNPWELLVAVVLSAQCTDIMVNKVTEKLFLKYKTLDAYVDADQREFEQDIKSTGFYHNKAKNVLASAKIVKEKFDGKVPDTMRELVSLPGVARKTANIILGNAYHVVVGIAVDTHVGRISQRLRLIDVKTIGGKKDLTFIRNGKTIVDFKKDADPVKIEQELMAAIPKDEWFGVTYRIIDHGRAICKSQHPLCASCTLKDLCPAARLGLASEA